MSTYYRTSYISSSNLDKDNLDNSQTEYVTVSRRHYIPEGSYVRRSLSRSGRIITTTETEGCPVKNCPVKTEVRTSRVFPTTNQVRISRDNSLVRTSRSTSKVRTSQVRTSRVYTSNGVRTSRLITTTEHQDCPVKGCPVKTEVRTSRTVIPGQIDVRVSRSGRSVKGSYQNLSDSPLLTEVKFSSIKNKSGEIRSAKLDQDDHDVKSLANSNCSIEPVEEKPVFARFDEKNEKKRKEQEKIESQEKIEKLEKELEELRKKEDQRAQQERFERIEEMIKENDRIKKEEEEARQKRIKKLLDSELSTKNDQEIPSYYNYTYTTEIKNPSFVSRREEMTGGDIFESYEKTRSTFL